MVVDGTETETEKDGTGVKVALISAAVAIVTAVISAYVTLHAQRGELHDVATEAERTRVELDKATVQAQAQLSSGVVVWKAADLQAGWAPNKDWPQVAYAKDSSGFVHLRGEAKGTEQGDAHPMFILPEGYRPSLKFEGPAACDEQNPHVSCAVIIDQAGRVTFYNKGPWASVDGVVFFSDH